ncbi:MAG TPA: serine/threonine-protein kinase, partial [Kofleriaceae bacterium]|nr:serine/threonine-protein kinase [Kofleriaceae bacterium]
MTGHAPATASELLIGRTLGDFVIEEKIGEGGFGVVYRATQPALEREAVIKVLRADRVSAAATERFLREARLASRIDHPYAAHVYAFGAEDDGLLWIAMELVRGTSLDEFLARQGPMPIERLGPLLEDVCAVVHAAHELGIVHRDIKPANIMVSSRAGRLVPKLLDLGIARLSLGPNPADEAASDQTLESVAADGISQDALVVGSPTYMAPEQWVDAATAGPPADIYALGILTYEALTGRPPFRGKNLLALARAHARKPAPPLDLGLPPELDEVLARALAKDPTERYANAVDFGASLCRAVGLHVRRAQIPKLPEPLRTEILGGAPQPVAECVALLDVAASAHEARDAVWSVLAVCAHYTGILALASRTRTGAPDDGDATEVTDELRALRSHGLSPSGWWALARGLCRPLQRYRVVAPVPDLVDVFFAADGGAGRGDVGWAAAWARRTDALLAHAAEAELLAELPELLAALAAVLESLLPLFQYRLAVPSGDGANVWQGVRHARQPQIAVRARALVENRPILVDAQDLPVLVLWPLVQVDPPAPGAAAEVFMLAGPDRRRARLLAYPQSFHRADPELWDWLAGTLRGLEHPDDAREVDEEQPPYRGLATFSAEDADGFFGREREVDAFLNRLEVEPFIAVVGPSGAGKSSFVHAGVVPGLGSAWRVISTRPGAQPLRALGVALSRAGVELGNFAAGLPEDPGALVEPVRVAAETTNSRFLIFVDQFEELFTLTHDPRIRELYVRALLAIAADAEAPVRLVFTLRDDFLIRAQSIEPLRDRLGHALQLLTQPLRNDLLRILIEPARQAGYEFEDPELPEEMVDAVADEPGGLALLSFTASKLWSKRDRHFRQLTRAGYEAIGGVGGALAMHAEATLEDMYPDQRRLVKEAFRHLITAEGTRAVIGRGDLVHVLGGAARAEETVERLVRARLLVASENESGDDQVEVIHEALLRGWPRLESWRRDDREGARMRDLLREGASTWRERGRPRGLLWRGDALAEYRLWRKSFDGRLTPGEDAFAEASIADEARARWRNRVILSAVIGIL